MRAWALLILAFALLPSGCSSERSTSSSSGDSDTTDSTTDDDDDDDDDDSSTSSCEANTSYSSSISSEEAYYDDEYNYYEITAQLDDSSDNSDIAAAYLYIQLFPGSGGLADTDSLTKGTYTITDDDTSYKTCGLCVFILTLEDSDSEFSDYGIHMATSGTVKLTQVSSTDGGTIAATLSDIEFQHVDVDFDTYETTVNSDGCETSLSSASLSASLDADSGSGGGGGSTCSANDSYDGDLVDDGQLAYYYDDEGYMEYWGLLDDTMDNSDYEGTYVLMYIVPGYGALADTENGVESGTYDLTNDDTQYSTCGLCILLIPYDSDGNGEYYMATKGTVTFDTITTDELIGSLSNFAFQHVDISEDSDGYYTSTAVDDDCTSTMSSFGFSTTVTEE